MNPKNALIKTVPPAPTEMSATRLIITNVPSNHLGSHSGPASAIFVSSIAPELLRGPDAFEILMRERFQKKTTEKLIEEACQEFQIFWDREIGGGAPAFKSLYRNCSPLMIEEALLKTALSYPENAAGMTRVQLFEANLAELPHTSSPSLLDYLLEINELVEPTEPRNSMCLNYMKAKAKRGKNRKAKQPTV